MQSFIEKREKYFRDRFPGGEGISGSLLSQMADRDEKSIIVDHNDYLGNGSNDGKIMMSGVFTEGDKQSLQHRVRREMASFMKMPACHISQSGMEANVNLIETVHTKDIPVYIDQYAHASFWKGLACCRARNIYKFRHNDYNHLYSLTEEYGSGIILVESVYSTDGSFAPLLEMDRLAKEGGHILIVDESHSLGIYGEGGSGYCSLLGITPHFITASLSKAVSVRAGVIFGDERSLKYMAEFGSAAIFSSVVELKDVLAIESSVQEMRKKDDVRRKLYEISNYIRSELRGLYEVRDTPYPSPIFGLTFKSEMETYHFQKYLQENGVFGAVFCPPATPKDASLVRLTINSSVSMKDAERIVGVVKKYQPSAKL